MEVGTVKPCFVRIGSLPPSALTNCAVYIEASPVKQKLTKTKNNRNLTREEKIILLPKKGLKKVKSGRVTKKKAGGKFQMRISSFFSPKQSRGSSPDSGISSRPDTPEDDDTESGSDEEEQDLETEADQHIKDDFMKSLDDDDEDEGVEDEDDGGSDYEEGKEEVNWAKKTAKPKKVKAVPVMPRIQQQPKLEYELKRDENTKKMEAMLAALKSKWTSHYKIFAPKPKERNFSGTPARRRGPVSPSEVRRSGRSTGSKVDYAGLEDAESSPRARREYTGRTTFNEEEFRFGQREKRPVNCNFNPNVDVLQPEDVTDSMIQKIHNGGKKKYSPDHGSSCHQCRQKTLDTKTVCRSGDCRGVVGQFCGRCLLMRYGESVAEALKDPNWCCPVCRKICNCSFCLETPTGQLYLYAKSQGFKSAHHYLVHLSNKWHQDHEDEKEDENVEDDQQDVGDKGEGKDQEDLREDQTDEKDQEIPESS